MSAPSEVSVCDCDGSGWLDCWECGGDGDGYVECIDDLCHGMSADESPCMHGEDASPCRECRGKGGWPCPVHMVATFPRTRSREPRL